MTPDRQRDVLPLPKFDLFHFDRKLVSQSVTRRLRKKNRILAWANEGIDVLNHLGRGESHRPHFVRGNLSSRLASQHILDAYSSIPPPPEDFCPEGALRELLGSAGLYGEASSDVLPYAKELVSWLSCGSHPVDLQAGLPEADRKLLHTWDTSMLRTGSEYQQHIKQNPPLRPYVDPALNNPRAYADFLLTLRKAGMLKWRRAPNRKPDLGIFFVGKKDGALRLIFDTRRLNLRFREPPKTDLPSAGAFAQLEGPEDGTCFLLAGTSKMPFTRPAFPIPWLTCLHFLTSQVLCSASMTSTVLISPLAL